MPCPCLRVWWEVGWRETGGDSRFGTGNVRGEILETRRWCALCEARYLNVTLRHRPGVGNVIQDSNRSAVPGEMKWTNKLARETA